MTKSGARLRRPSKTASSNRGRFLMDDQPLDELPELPAEASQQAEGYRGTRQSRANGQDGAAKHHRFTLLRFKNVRLAVTAAYLVKDIIPREGLVLIWGPPKCGKSFWLLDLVMHIARGLE